MMPKTGYLTPMHVFVLTSSFFVVLAVVESLIVYQLHKRHAAKEAVVRKFAQSAGVNVFKKQAFVAAPKAESAAGDGASGTPAVPRLAAKRKGKKAAVAPAPAAAKKPLYSPRIARREKGASPPPVAPLRLDMNGANNDAESGAARSPPEKLKCQDWLMQWARLRLDSASLLAFPVVYGVVTLALFS